MDLRESIVQELGSNLFDKVSNEPLIHAYLLEVTEQIVEDYITRKPDSPVPFQGLSEMVRLVAQRCTFEIEDNNSEIRIIKGDNIPLTFIEKNLNETYPLPLGVYTTVLFKKFLENGMVDISNYSSIDQELVIGLVNGSIYDVD